MNENEWVTEWMSKCVRKLVCEREREAVSEWASEGESERQWVSEWVIKECRCMPHSDRQKRPCSDEGLSLEKAVICFSSIYRWKDTPTDNKEMMACYLLQEMELSSPLLNKKKQKRNWEIEVPCVQPGYTVAIDTESTPIVTCNSNLNFKGAVSPIVPSVPKCSSRHFSFHRKYVCFE